MASSVDQLTNGARHSVDASQQANPLSSSAGTVATQGVSEVSQVVRTMQEIYASSKKISEIIGVIGVIDDIAFQTNIPALNAAVEAAKEIKNLIETSAERLGAGTKLADSVGKTMAETVHSVKPQLHGAIRPKSGRARSDSGKLR